MFKVLKKLLGLIFLFYICGFAVAENPFNPEYCSIGDKPFVSPLSFVDFNFDGGIQILEGANAKILCDDNVIAVSDSFEVENYVGTQCVKGLLSVYFDDLLLPLGKSYNITLKSGSIATSDGKEVLNHDIIQNFYVPENLGEHSFSMQEGITLSQATYSNDLPFVFWQIETEASGDSKFILYRDGIQQCEIPADVGWDWDCGYAHPKIDTTLYFDKDINYSIVLPAGEVHALYREDITNDKVIFNFVGDHSIAKVKGIDSFEDNYNTIHDLNGVVVSKPLDGQIYIKDRKKYILK
ncbi:MAG: hypothetical protein NC131_11260 [Roseburia sp.]|nr:hypothetical protein [Roseburia sp.]